MSLILEALRKSEAERRRGQAPDLFAAPGARIEKRLRPRSAWPGLLGVVLVAVSALWAGRALWQERAAESEPVAAEQTPMANAAPRFETLPDESAVAATIPAPAPDPVATAPAAIAPAPAAAALAPTPVATAVLAPAEVARAEPSSVIAKPVPPPLTSDAAVTPETGPPPMRLADLGPDERAALPPLRLSMHVWTADPGTRFAIVDGARLGEGARVGEAVVAEITRDGLVLAWQGRRLHVPRP